MLESLTETEVRLWYAHKAFEYDWGRAPRAERRATIAREKSLVPCHL